jgi:hypothetical protein
MEVRHRSPYSYTAAPATLTPEGYISKDIYFLGISKYHIHILSYILFLAFSARDFGFQRQYFSFCTAISAISAVICHFLTALLIDQGFNSIQ